MREIKFRAWDKDQDRMIYPKIIGLNYERFAWDHSRSWLHNCQEWDGEEGFIDNPQLMQYTGLKDKNGKEIYEGDIVKYQMPDGPPIYDVTEYVEEVHFTDGSFDVDGCPLYVVADDCEVIGNVFENADLIQ